ncbi:MAG: hypothetical protein QGH15_06260 [Kiritimatiellia bacterium]|nr:hypothetical protein [Kiritimatiellia bacterium]
MTIANDKDRDNDQDEDRLSNQCFQATPRKARLKHTFCAGETMTMSEWWEHNAKYVKAWVAYTMIVMLMGWVTHYVLRLLSVPNQSSEWTPGTITFVVIFGLFNLAISVLLYRLTVLKFMVTREAWSSSIHNHPYRPYIFGWLSYVIICLGVFALTGMFLGQISSAFPWGSHALHCIIAFFVFRMVVRKYVLPHTYETT